MARTARALPGRLQLLVRLLRLVRLLLMRLTTLDLGESVNLQRQAGTCQAGAAKQQLPALGVLAGAGELPAAALAGAAITHAPCRKQSR
jgi:hypothetical protein